jgi:type I site-specific restriction endonuclease
LAVEDAVAKGRRELLIAMATGTFQLAKVAVTHNLFAAILDRIARLTIPPPLVAGHGT